jgi:hypothetical protein
MNLTIVTASASRWRTAVPREPEAWGRAGAVALVQGFEGLLDWPAYTLPRVLRLR